MNEQYTYIEVRKTAPSVFEIYDNTSPNSAVASSDYAGRIMPFEGIYNNDSSFTITTKTGHPLYNHQLWSVFRYVDAINGNNSFIPVSGLDLFRKLTARGFFDTENVESPVDTIDQDNIGRVKTFFYTKEERQSSLSLDVASKINALPTFTVSEKDDLHFIGFETEESRGGFILSTGNTLRYRFINLGKGTYGQNGTPITNNNLDFIVERRLTITDIENDPTTDIVQYNLAEGQTISQWLNTQNPAITIKPVDEGYTLFKSEGQTTYLFVGDSGTYGTGEAQSTDAYFESFSNQIPSSGVQSVGGYKVYNNDPQNPQIIYPIGDNRNFQVYGSVQGFNGLGQSLRYLTDVWRKIDLRPIVPGLTSAITEILKNGNDLFMVANTTASTNETRPIKLMNMREAGIVDNELIYDVIDNRDLALKVRTHGSDLHRGYVYLSTRPEVGSSIPTQIVKVNPKNLNDVRILEIPNTRATDIIGYKDNVYIYAANPAQTKMSFIKIDQDLKGYSVVFEWEREMVGAFKAPQAVPFIIYNDEIYTLHALVDATSTKKNIIVDVYNFKGEKVRTANLQINPNNETRPFYYNPHWMTVINGKLIITPTGTGLATPPGVNSWEILRIDCESLLLEEAYQLPNAVTDDVFTDDAGYIYTNGEGSNYDNTYLGKVYYLDFANTYQNLVSPWTSTGTINGKIFVDKEAQIVNVSQLNYDFKYQPGIIYLTSKGWQNGVKNTGAGIELNDVIFYFGSDGRYGNWQYINATADNNVQNINNYLFFGIEINA